MKKYILMADIKESGRKKANKLMKDFKKITDIIREEKKSFFLSPITITLGDEFQSIVKTLGDGLDIIISLEELRLKKEKDFYLRYVLNYGEIETPINKEKAHGMLGKGLSETREILEDEKKKDLKFYIKSKNPDISKQLNFALIIYQHFIDSWKLKDYKIVSSFIEHKDYKKVAKELNKNVSLMWKRGKSLNIKEYFVIKKLIYSLSRRDS
ncbi:MAG: SatD family protein [Elusimicrobiota bacterium]